MALRETRARQLIGTAVLLSVLLATGCTMPNGNANTCDWRQQRCHAICHSAEEVCAVVRDLAWVPPWLRKATPAASSA